MPKLTITGSSKHSAEETFKRICTMLDSDKELRKLDPSYKCNFDKAKLSGTAKGSLFSADMKILGQDSGAEVQIAIDLPFHLALVKGLVEKTLKKKISEILV